MFGGNGKRLAETQFIGFVQRGFMPPAFGLVGNEDDRLATAAHAPRELTVRRRHAGARVKHEEHDIRVIDRHFGLRTHARFEAVALDVVEAGRVEDAEPQVTEACFTLAAVTGDAGLVIDEGDLAADQPVEEGRLANIGPPHDGDCCCHCGSWNVSVVVVGGAQPCSFSAQPAGATASAALEVDPTCMFCFSGKVGRPGMASSRWPGRTVLLV